MPTAEQPHFSFQNVQLQMRFFLPSQCRAPTGHDRVMLYPNGSPEATSTPSEGYSNSIHQGNTCRPAKLPTDACVSHHRALSRPPGIALHGDMFYRTSAKGGTPTANQEQTNSL
ncbi:hypothetical protein B9Z55_013199 [Caenorhabditis nigoni]|uniref:Uncharacterized protein n=1 Tax=Caenorhabditis nigoni TaxID=1611254 RepID=A0A2G5U0M4_9PELO|nr:hypothetical protein B9Z55_013199 [Caenorhabditis nigoni]